MTLADISQCTMLESQKKTPSNIGDSVRNMMKKAFHEERLCCGVFQCVNLLESDADSVMVCVLPEASSQNITTRIQHKLIEAYCRENSIKVLKVDNAEKLDMLFSATANNINKTHDGGNDRNSVTDLDLSCVLVKYPKTLSAEDEYISSLCEDFICIDQFLYSTVELRV
ncbi:hypothetical protein CHS0354_010757 [Potamilus streckersoni]|uniref:Ribosomal protein eL8/eL30/eS12/Gadd45 domain-containing protein n=1 Tax=Potamilus streckersoni TaxID=2493646 RepID=A0AAE0TAC5_9BIVA|nr:hypothetical protein CHS0354_010757 [Potamilus streckersoni]